MSESGRPNAGITRRDFLKLAGAGAMGLAGASMLGAQAYRKYGPGEVPGALQLGGSGMNVVLITMDTLRKDHIGAYGNAWIQTPTLDALARESLRFTEAYPESGWTIPARRAIHTGIRTFPFADYDPAKGENVIAYGWQPIPQDQTTLAEVLKSRGYTTMMVTDNVHKYKPSMNFHRGFDVFEFIRGQEKDLYRPLWMCPEEKIQQSLMKSRRKVEGKLRQYFANTAHRSTEEDWFPPQVFRRAAQFLEGVRESDNPFFMAVDVFDPHEALGPARGLHRPLQRRIRRPRALRLRLRRRRLPLGGGAAAHGRALRRRGHAGRPLAGTLHGQAGRPGSHGNNGHRVAERPRSRPRRPRHRGQTLLGPVARGGEHPVLYPASGRPGRGAGERLPRFDPRRGADGPGPRGYRAARRGAGRGSLCVLLDGDEPASRPYATLAVHDYVWAKDDRHVLISQNDGSRAKLYDLDEDPGQNKNIAWRNPDVVKRMFEDYALKDAGGPLPNY